MFKGFKLFKEKRDDDAAKRTRIAAIKKERHQLRKDILHLRRSYNKDLVVMRNSARDLGEEMNILKKSLQGESSKADSHGDIMIKGVWVNSPNHVG